MPIAEATTLVFVSPLFVTALSMIALKERVGPGRIVCVVAGLVGVVMVARPDFRAFDYAMFLPVCSALCWATAMALTRTTQWRGDSLLTTLLWSAIAGFVLLCLVVPGLFTPLTWRQVVVAASMSLLWTGGQITVVAAYRLGQVAAVAPFSYTQIVWSLFFGWLVFADFPDRTALVGTIVIIVSGVVAARLSARGG
jgi:drug/metabolite transporter (DMT)-like permease